MGVPQLVKQVAARKKAGASQANTTKEYLLVVLLLGLLAGGLDDGRRNAVKVTLSVLRDAASTTGVKLKDTDLAEGLNDLALDCESKKVSSLL